jgi:hypothetical protein
MDTLMISLKESSAKQQQKTPQNQTIPIHRTVPVFAVSFCFFGTAPISTLPAKQTFCDISHYFYL